MKILKIMLLLYAFLNFHCDLFFDVRYLDTCFKNFFQMIGCGIFVFTFLFVIDFNLSIALWSENKVCIYLSKVYSDCFMS